MKIILMVEKPDPVDKPAVELTALLDAGEWNLVIIAAEDYYEIVEKRKKRRAKR